MHFCGVNHRLRHAVTDSGSQSKPRHPRTCVRYSEIGSFEFDFVKPIETIHFAVYSIQYAYAGCIQKSSNSQPTTNLVFCQVFLSYPLLAKEGCSIRFVIIPRWPSNGILVPGRASFDCVPRSAVSQKSIIGPLYFNVRFLHDVLFTFISNLRDHLLIFAFHCVCSPSIISRTNIKNTI
jgi:hypothetical protein